MVVAVVEVTKLWRLEVRRVCRGREERIGLWEETKVFRLAMG
jgi:hypothetical protein